MRCVKVMIGLLIASIPLQVDAAPNPRWNVIHEQDASTTEIRFDWVVRSGSLADPTDRSGLANFTGRAILRGTATRPHADVLRTLQALQATIQVEATREATIFHCRLPSSRFQPFLYLLRDLFTQPEFDPLEVDLLRSEILQEYRIRQKIPLQLGIRAALTEWYSGTPAENDPFGNPNSIQRINSVDLRGFFRSHYGSANSVLALVTPFDETWVRDRIEQELNTIAVLSLDARPISSPIRTQKSGIVVAVPGATEVFFHLLNGSVASSHPDRLALELADLILGAGTDSRLATLANSQPDWFSSLSSGIDVFGPVLSGPGNWVLSGTAPATQSISAIRAASDELERLVGQGVLDDELLRAKDELRSASTPGFADTSSDRLARRLLAFLQSRTLVPGFGSELDGWTSPLVADRLRQDIDPTRQVVLAIGDPTHSTAALEALPGMSRVRVVVPAKF